VALVSSHVLSNYRRIELLSSMDVTVDLFLQCLLCEIRVLLSDEDSENIRAVARNADHLMVLHNPQTHEIMVAAVTSATVAEGKKTAISGSSPANQEVQEDCQEASWLQEQQQAVIPFFFHAN
jgi:hypothetical protein